MDSLDQKLAEARERLFKQMVSGFKREHVFDAAAQVAREVVAEKNAEIARLKSENAALVAQGDAPSDGTTSIPALASHAR